MKKYGIILTLLLAGSCIADDNFASKLVGNYEGEIWSNGPNPGRTIFSIDSNENISAVYSFQGFSNLEKGTLKNCKKKPQKGRLICTWQDKYGSGTLDINFSNDYGSFSGHWGMGSSSVEYSWNGERVN